MQTKTKTDYGQPNLGAVFGYAIPPVSLKQYYGFANYDFTNLHTNIATASVNWKVSDTVGLRNVTRWAGYRREMEATIGGLNATTLGGTPVTASTPYDQLAATRPTTRRATTTTRYSSTRPMSPGRSPQAR